jgi:6-pyruvoyl-tetrahydropterin synthase
MALMAFTKRYSFRSVHSLNTGLHREQLHGHEYFVEVTLRAPDFKAADAVLEEQVLSRLHARDLSAVIAPATGEVLVEWIHARLNETPLAPALLGVALQETRKNRFVSSDSNVHLL